MSSLFDLDGRIVVVTGGLGQLGRQFSVALIKHGARVASLDRIRSGDPSLGGLVPAELQNCLLMLVADVTSRSSLEAALKIIEARWGSPFGLVNNAALDIPPDAAESESGPYESFPDNAFDRVIEVNVKGVHLCCQVFGGVMAKAGRGSIVNVGSIYGLVSPDQRLYQYRRDAGEVFFKPVAYSVSKSALYALTRYLAVYWAASQVRVNIVTFAGVANNQDERFVQAYLHKIPLGRMAYESDYNGIIVYLMSDASSYMTGSNIVIDGGFTAM
jgi:NAD(P)-dependent dehydrogenase (short-subunit alcohol dehydrogenase family)